MTDAKAQSPIIQTIAKQGNRQAVKVGNVIMGGGHPVVVQSMTNTDTADVESTVAQVADLHRAGSEIVRVTVNNSDAAAAVPKIVERLDSMGLNVPIVGDFHYNGHRLLEQHPACASALAKYRINPGNVGRGKKRDDQFAYMIETAIANDKPVRIGVNWGSLDQSVLARLMDENAKAKVPLPTKAIQHKAIITSALESARMAEEIGLAKDKIVISCKTSGVQDLVSIYEQINALDDYALHLGLTEAGMGSKGIVASTAALSLLLQQQIGDTIRISLTPEPGQARKEEVVVAQQILQTMGLRSFTPMVVACPGCGRTTSTYFQQLAKDIQSYLLEQMPVWRKQYKGVEDMTVAVMGCVVNGPGESKHANIGISLPGTGERPVAPVYIDGEQDVTLKGDHIAEEFQEIVERYVDKKYSAAS